VCIRRVSFAIWAQNPETLNPNAQPLNPEAPEASGIEPQARSPAPRAPSPGTPTCEPGHFTPCPLEPEFSRCQARMDRSLVMRTGCQRPTLSDAGSCELLKSWVMSHTLRSTFRSAALTAPKPSCGGGAVTPLLASALAFSRPTGLPDGMPRRVASDHSYSYGQKRGKCS